MTRKKRGKNKNRSEESTNTHEKESAKMKTDEENPQGDIKERGQTSKQGTVSAMPFCRTYPDVKYEGMDHLVNDKGDDLGYNSKKTVYRGTFHRTWHWTKMVACVPVKVIDFVISNILRLNMFMYWKVAGRLPTFLDKYCMYDERVVKLEFDIGELENENASLRDSMLTMKTEKQTALTRLSEVVSVKLRDNNPNIVDLNDQCRPTKLAEMFSELYDNEWTGAYSILEEPFGEEYSIVVLLDIVMSLPGAQQTSKWLKDSRKARIRNRIQDVEKDYEQRLLEKFKENKLAELLSQNEMKLYITKCVELCLLMVTTDPQVHLSCPGWTPGLKNQVKAKSTEDKEFEKAYFENHEEKDKPDLPHSTRERNIFDKDLYKEYTTRGTYLDYVVWPALFLYREGPLLSKGIAQGRKEQQWEPKKEQWA